MSPGDNNKEKLGIKRRFFPNNVYELLTFLTMMYNNIIIEEI